MKTMNLNLGEKLKRTLNREKMKKAWYKFSLSRLSIVGLVIVLLFVIVAVFAEYLSPYPESAYQSNYDDKLMGIGWNHLLGTDHMGRDILSRIMFGCRSSLGLGFIVIMIAVPIGTMLGLTAGYLHGTIADLVIMRVTDIFMAIPGMIMALVVAAILGPSLINNVMAIAFFWWPWYCRLAYGASLSVKGEFYVISSRLTGASTSHILTREILPNVLSPIMTKATLDFGWVIMVASTLSFLGLGVSPPTSDLGCMVASGRMYMPTHWWMTIGPAVAILAIVLGFNLLGDGLRDVLAVEEF